MPLLDNDFGLYNLDFGLSWEVDFWGRFRRMIESESAQLQAEMAGYDAVMVSLTAEVARAYVLLRTLQARIALAEQNVVTQERTLADRRRQASQWSGDRTRRAAGAAPFSTGPKRPFRRCRRT